VSSAGVEAVAVATAVFAATVPEGVVAASAAVTPVVNVAATAVARVILTMRRRAALRAASRDAGVAPCGALWWGLRGMPA
jgi:hypothetical protein